VYNYPMVPFPVLNLNFKVTRYLLMSSTYCVRS